MKHFKRRTALRIAAVSVLLASLASPVAWLVERENAEAGIVSLAIEESNRLLHHFNAIDLSGPEAREHATEAANTISGGLFDIAEIYDPQGRKLAESMTPKGAALELELPEHSTPNYRAASYKSLKLPGDVWVLRVFIPLRQSANEVTQPITGYFEGVRVVPTWQREQLFANALTSALLAGLASLLCGLALYPVMLHLAAENVRKAHALLDSHLSIIEALGRAIAKRDSDTGSHNYRVAWSAARIAEGMGFQGRAMQALMAGSFLHDIGKIGIPDAILLKPGQLDDAEMAIMRTHVTQGVEIVQGMGWFEGASAVVASHHEKWNGSGYPQQLAGTNIPLAARIFAVADVFDALCSRRPYKEPMTFEAAMAILKRDTGSHFDPAVMAVFRPLARSTFDRLNGISEHEARQLLSERMRLHIEL